MKIFQATILTAFFYCSTAGAAENPWVAMTIGDLQGIHDVLRDNHPGPVDPNNPRYRQWLENGLTQAKTRAGTAQSFADYVRALEFYTNGFQDDHIGVGLSVRMQDDRWPRFIVGGDSADTVHVISADASAGVPVGATLISCDGQNVDKLMADRVDPYLWNSAIAHQRFDHVEELFYMDAADTRQKLQSCVFSSGSVKLTWRRIDADDLEKKIEAARAPRLSPLQIRRLNGVTLISVPSFAYQDAASVAKIRALIDDLARQAPKLRNQTVVFDVRGNTGGDSAWGEEIVKTYWGESWLSYVKSQFDTRTAWRASPANLDMIDFDLQRDQAAGLTDSAAEWKSIRAAVQAALDAHKPLAETGEPPKPANSHPPPNPVTGRVYFLTDHVCRSACLDFADIMLGLPGVVHVGLPTAADAIYIDNTYLLLPSRLAGIGYSMKLIVNRKRKNNEWYEPKILWPGGDVSDESIARWVATLH